MCFCPLTWLTWCFYRGFTLPPWSIRVKACIETSSLQPEQEKGSVWWSDTSNSLGISSETTHTISAQNVQKREKRSSWFCQFTFGSVFVHVSRGLQCRLWTHSLSSAPVCATHTNIFHRINTFSPNTDTDTKIQGIWRYWVLTQRQWFPPKKFCKKSVNLSVWENHSCMRTVTQGCSYIPGLRVTTVYVETFIQQHPFQACAKCNYVV